MTKTLSEIGLFDTTRRRRYSSTMPTIAFTPEKAQLLDDFVADIPNLLLQWHAFKNSAIQSRALKAYTDAMDLYKPWNLMWQRDIQTAFDSIGASWKSPIVSKAVYAASDALCSPGAYVPLGAAWSPVLRTASRDALLLSATILAYGELEHPACQRAIARWALWRTNNYVLGDCDGTLRHVAF